MIARISLSACLAACVMWPSSVSAQWRASATDSRQEAAKPDPAQIVLGQSPDVPIQLAGGYAPQSGVDSYGDGSGFAAPIYQTQALPWEREGNSPIRRFFKEVLPNNYFRVEYLNWNIDDIGAQVVGAPSALIPDATQSPRRVQYQSNAFFGMIGQQGPPASSQTLVVPSAEPISFNRVSGVRATYGIPLQFGRLEFSGFALEESDSQILDPSFGPVRGDRVLTVPEFQAQAFVLAQTFVVNQPYVTTTAGTVLAVAQNIGAGAGLINNIPANSLLPPSAFPFPPGNPPIAIPPLPPGTQTRPLVDLANPLTGVITFNTPLPTGSFFTQQNFQGQLVTFDTSFAAIVQANLQGTTPLNGPFYIRGANSNTPNPFNPLISPPVPIPNVIDPSRVPIPQFPDRFPGGDAVIVVPAGSLIFPSVSVLLADQFSPGGITLPAGTILRTTETGFPAMPLLSNGQVGTNFLIFDGGYGADYHSDVWGTEAKLILDIGPNSHGFTLNPLVGFRYMSFDEQFRQVGLSSLNVLVLDQIQTTFIVPEPLRASVIDSKAQNNLYGLQIGASAEYNNKYVTLGVEPRISLGVNQYEAEVTTNQLRSILDPRFTTRQDDTTFAPVFDMSMYGQVHVTPNFSLHAGYNFTYLFKVTRPAENIIYNDNGPFAPPGVVVDARTQDAHIQGLTVGGEFRFRDLKFR